MCQSRRVREVRGEKELKVTEDERHRYDCMARNTSFLRECDRVIQSWILFAVHKQAIVSALRVPARAVHTLKFIDAVMTSVM